MSSILIFEISFDSKVIFGKITLLGSSPNSYPLDDIIDIY